MSEPGADLFDNRPALAEVDADERFRQVFAEVAASELPVTASDVARAFRQGEVVVRLVLETLESLRDNGRIDLTTQGWKLAGYEQRHGPSRRFGTWEIDKLERHFDLHCRTKDELELLALELMRRRDSTRVRSLRRRVQNRLSQIGCEPRTLFGDS